MPFFMHRKTTGQKISITEHRKKLSEALTQSKEEEIDSSTRPRHHLVKKEGSAHKVRRYCTACYNNNSQTFGPKMAKKVT